MISTTDNYLKIPTESSVFLKIEISQGEMADGPYNIQFDNIQLNFSTTQ